MTITIRPIDREDKQGWLDLWQGYMEHYGETASANLTFATFDRLATRDHPLRARLACDADGNILGFVHYFLHESTWHTREVCLIEDIFVTPEQRRQGIGRRLVEDVARVAGINRWGRLYASIPSTDKAAISFFRELTQETDWVVFDYKF